MKKIYITGIAGTGKSTIGRELSKRGIYSISIDDVPGLCVWFNKETGERVSYDVELNKEFIDTHNWACDIEKLKELMGEAGDVVVVLGSASNQDDYLDMFDKVLLLQCAPETFLKRIDERDDNEYGKEETTKDLILDWYKTFENKMLKRGAISIDVEKPIDEVVEEVMGYIKS